MEPTEIMNHQITYSSSDPPAGGESRSYGYSDTKTLSSPQACPPVGEVEQYYNYIKILKDGLFVGFPKT